MTIDKRKFIRSTSDIVNSFNPFHCSATKTAPKPSPFFDKSAPNPRCQSIISSNHKSLALPFPFSLSFSLSLSLSLSLFVCHASMALSWRINYLHFIATANACSHPWRGTVGRNLLGPSTYKHTAPQGPRSVPAAVCVCAPEAHRHKASAYQFATTS